MDKIFISEPNQFSKEMKDTLTERGYLVVEATNFDKVKLLADMELSAITGNDFLMAALKGVVENRDASVTFVRELYVRLSNNEKKSAS